MEVLADAYLLIRRLIAMLGFDSRQEALAVQKDGKVWLPEALIDLFQVFEVGSPGKSPSESRTRVVLGDDPFSRFQTGEKLGLVAPPVFGVLHLEVFGRKLVCSPELRIPQVFIDERSFRLQVIQRILEPARLLPLGNQVLYQTLRLRCLSDAVDAVPRYHLSPHRACSSRPSPRPSSAWANSPSKVPEGPFIYK